MEPKTPQSLPSTWSIVVRAQGSGPEARQALDQLIRRYDRTVVAMIRSRGHPPNLSAEELKQEFLTRVIARNGIQKLDRERGKFRNWLYVAVKFFMGHVWEQWRTSEGLPGRPHRRPLTPEQDESPRYDGRTAPLFHRPLTPEQIVMRQYAEETMECARQRLRERTPNLDRFDRLERFFAGPLLDFAELGPIAEELKITPNALSAYITDMKAKYKRVLREVIADTLDVDPATPEGARAVEEELKELYALLRPEPASEDVILEPS